MFNLEQTLTSRERKEIISEGLDYHIAAYCGDVYFTSLDLFPGFNLLRGVMLQRQEGFDGITSAIDEDGEPGIWVSEQKGFVTDSMKSRVVERFNLSEEYFNADDDAFLPFLFAHELGHIAQAEQQFTTYFGRLGEERIDHTQDYSGYVNSDSEINADYIAAVIIGNSRLGSEIGFFPPEEPPLAWREWGIAHPMHHTIALNLSERKQLSHHYLIPPIQTKLS